MTLSTHEEHPSGRRMTRRVLRGFSPQEFASVRTRVGFKVSDLARLAGIAPTTIYHWETGHVTPQVDVLAKVMAVLQEPIEAVVLVPPDRRYPADLRALKGMTQPQLGAATQIPTTTIKKIERADCALSEPRAEAIACVLGVEVELYRAAYQRAKARPPGAPA